MTYMGPHSRLQWPPDPNRPPIAALGDQQCVSGPKGLPGAPVLLSIRTSLFAMCDILFVRHKCYEYILMWNAEYVIDVKHPTKSSR